LTKTRSEKTLLNVRVNDRFAIVARHNEQDLSKIITQNHRYVVKDMLVLQQIRKRAMHERETVLVLHRHFVSDDQLRASQKLVQMRIANDIADRFVRNLQRNLESKVRCLIVRQ
jgi:hypothetical protein